MNVKVLGILMILCFSITWILPDSINYRKPTLREFARLEHERLEATSIEIVELKKREDMNDNLKEEKVEVVPESSENPSTVV